MDVARKNALQKWVDQCGGADAAGKKLGVTGHAVRVWLRGQGCPRVQTIQRISELSRGKFSFLAILSSTLPKKK